MLIEAETLTARWHSSHIVLMLQSSGALLAKQEWIVTRLGDQVAVAALHVTLTRQMPLPHLLSLQLPIPPPRIAFCDAPQIVSDGSKTSIFLYAAEASQVQLASYVRLIRLTLGLSLESEPRRFHVSLSNRSGRLEDSVANVWELPASPV